MVLRYHCTSESFKSRGYWKGHLSVSGSVDMENFHLNILFACCLGATSGNAKSKLQLQVMLSGSYDVRVEPYPLCPHSCEASALSLNHLPGLKNLHL